MRAIYAIRHAEAQKSIRDVHGGEGTPLTSRGRKQCSLIAKQLISRLDARDRCLLVGHQIPQVRETVSILAETLKLPTVWDERLRGISLGVLAGLSRADAEQLWPDAAERLELWRQGKLAIDSLNIPNAESVNQFRTRIEEMWSDWLKMTDVDVLIPICSRSALIMIVNLIRMGKDFNYTDYKPFVFGTGSLTRFYVLEGASEIRYLDRRILDED